VFKAGIQIRTHSMARFCTILSGAVFVMAGLSAAGAQTARPVQPGRPQPGQRSVPQPQQQAVPAPIATQQPGQPPTAPLKPAAQPAQPPAPAAPPLVTYRDGLLTVQAANSTLSSVLTAIRGKTGIEFEGQENSSDHVALSLGPAPAGEVLSAIFAGSKFDFVAIGRPDNPSIVQRVIFTPKTQPGAAPAAATAAAQPQPRPNNGQEGGEEEDAPDETPNASAPEPQDTAAQPPPTTEPAPQTQPQPKSPEQLLQELQDMRKQQQMQQEGAQPPNPNQVPRKVPPVPR
jgi:DNA polymerase-3 subunit gamma/tau